MHDVKKNQMRVNSLKSFFIFFSLFFLAVPVNAAIKPSVRVFSPEEYYGKKVSVTCHNVRTNTKILDLDVVVGQELFREEKIQSNNEDGDHLSCTINDNLKCEIEEPQQSIYAKYPAEDPTASREPWEFHIGYTEENGKVICYLFPDFIPD